jgi:hypothetical protein
MANASTKEGHFRSFPTRQTRRHMLRRLKEDGNERYRKLDAHGGAIHQARSVSPGKLMPIPDAVYGYSQLSTLNAAAASCQMHLEIFFAVIVGKFFARLDVTERENIHTTPADIDLTIRRAGVIDKAGSIRRYVPVDHARIARPKKVLPAILFYLFSCGWASEVFDDA